MTRARDLARLGNSQALSVDSNLNVGINSTAPVSKLNVVGVVSATSFYGDGANLTNVGFDTSYVVSVATTTGTLNVGTGITANVSGINVTGVITATGTLNVGTGITANASGINVTGVITASSFSGTVPSSNLSGALPALDGSALTNLNIPTGFNELDAALFN